MCQHPRASRIERLTGEARSVVGELELAHRRSQLESLLAQARANPLAPYQAKAWYPRFVVWELTLACNMSCAHCGSSAGRARADELGLDEMLAVCDELGTLGCERLTLLGGEPLLHPHWLEVAERLHRNRVRVNVITNGGTLHREEVLEKLAAAPLSLVGVSLDGLATNHDLLRQKPGSFLRILRGIDDLTARGVPVGVTTVVTESNLPELGSLHELLAARGVRLWQLQIGSPLGRLRPDDPRLLRPERLPQLCDRILELQAKEGPRVHVADNIGYYGSYEELGLRRKRAGGACLWTGCHAGIQALGLDSNGDVKGCESLPSVPRFIEGNVRERSLADIWNDPDAFRYTRRFSLLDLEGACATCRFGALCKAGCTSAAHARTGSVGDNPMCVHRAAASGR